MTDRLDPTSLALMRRRLCGPQRMPHRAHRPPADMPPPAPPPRAAALLKLLSVTPLSREDALSILGGDYFAAWAAFHWLRDGGYLEQCNGEGRRRPWCARPGATVQVAA